MTTTTTTAPCHAGQPVFALDCRGLDGTSDCYHPGLPHISDFATGDPACNQKHPGGTGRCTLPADHLGAHAAGNGDYLTAVWEGERALWVISSVGGDGEHIGSGGFSWVPERCEYPTGADPDTLFDREVASLTGFAQGRVRKVRLPVPARVFDLACSADPDVRVPVTEWVEAHHLDDVEVRLRPDREHLHTPGDPEPGVVCVVQKQTLDNGYDMNCGAPEVHDPLPGLRLMPRAEVAALEDNRESSDCFALDHDWIGGHTGGFYVRFDSTAPYPVEDTDPADVPGVNEGTPQAVVNWLAWADRNRNLLGRP